MTLRLSLATPWATRVKDIRLDVSAYLVRVCKNFLDEQVVACHEDGQAVAKDVATSQRTVASVGEFEFEVPLQGLDIHLRGHSCFLEDEEPNRASFRAKHHRLIVTLNVEPSSYDTNFKSKEPLDVLLCVTGLDSHIQFRAVPFGLERSVVGVKLWPCALLVAGWLRQMFQRKGAQHRFGRVVELGSGTGICGILAAEHGADEVFLTDSDARVLSFLRANVLDFRRRIRMSRFTVERLDFSSITSVDDFHESQGPFDVVVCSDVIYEHKLVEPLFQAAKTLLRHPFGQLVLGVELRPCGVDLAVALPEIAAQCGFVLNDCTEESKPWALSAPPELNVPALDIRHRMFVGLPLALDQEKHNKELNV